MEETPPAPPPAAPEASAAGAPPPAAPEVLAAPAADAPPAPAPPSEGPEAPQAAPAASEAGHVIKEYIWATGRRKTAVARVRLRPAGTGLIVVNEKPYDKHFTSLQHYLIVKAPLLATDTLSKYDILARVDGGGLMGQAGAMCLGIARALKKAEPDLEPKLRAGGFLSRDSRRKERKHFGHKGARRSFQWTKR